MNMNMKKLWSMVSLLGLSGALMAPAHAAYHEEVRIYNDGVVVLYIGWYPDPPYAGEPQYLYVLPFANVVFDENGDFMDGTPIVVSDNDDPNSETSADDTVDLSAKVQLLEAPDPSAAVLEEADLPGKFTELYPGYNYYALAFIPKKAGAYAFVLNGEINGVAFDNERFVCKPASELHSLEFNGFSCVGKRDKRLRVAPVPLPSYK